MFSFFVGVLFLCFLVKGFFQLFDVACAFFKNKFGRFSGF